MSYGLRNKLILILVAICIASAPLAAVTYEYNPNIVPHTRYNTQLGDCFYFYGYGSCNVTKTECSGVDLGQNKWVNLGDACDRNIAPLLQYTPVASGREGQRLTLDAYCLDDDPVNLTLEGWMSEKSKTLSYTDAGTHNVLATCTDSFGKTAQGEITITVTDTNRAPLFRSIEAI